MRHMAKVGTSEYFPLRQWLNRKGAAKREEFVLQPDPYEALAHFLTAMARQTDPGHSEITPASLPATPQSYTDFFQSLWDWHLHESGEG